MKTLLFLPFFLALPAYAGTSAKEVIAPPPNPCLMSWFVGGSVGYLTELEEPMYTLHAGLSNSCWTLAGWNMSLFLEVGYTQKDEDYHGRYDGDLVPKDLSFDIDELGQALHAAADITGFNTGYDLDIVPITANIKFERAITGNLNVYLGGGLGVAWVGLDLYGGPGVEWSDSDWVFYGQIFGGLSYNVTPNFEVYGGARWIYMSDADVNFLGTTASLELGSDCLLELGMRFKF
jgi:opacity protein-like surface antigen